MYKLKAEFTLYVEVSTSAVLISATKNTSDFLFVCFFHPKENCKMMSLKCYILELRMVIVEEVGSENPKTHCVMDFNERLPDLDNGASAYPVSPF